MAVGTEDVLERAVEAGELGRDEAVTLAAGPLRDTALALYPEVLEAG